MPARTKNYYSKKARIDKLGIKRSFIMPTRAKFCLNLIAKYSIANFLIKCNNIVKF